MYYWISHFSGCSSSTVVAIALGFKPILAIENNLRIAKIYRNNIDFHIIWGDIKDIEKSQIYFVPSESERKSKDDGRKDSNGRQDIIDIHIGKNDLENGITKKVDTRVLARLQGFPDDFKWSSSFKLNTHVIGNSIPPVLMQKICEEIRSITR